MSSATTFANDNSLLDSKPYVEHHPTFGYSYIPNVDMELPRPGGGQYRMVTNSQRNSQRPRVRFQKTAWRQSDHYLRRFDGRRPVHQQ